MNKNDERIKNRQLRRRALKYVQELSNPDVVELVSIQNRTSSHSINESSSDVASASIFNWESVRDIAISNVSNRGAYDEDDGSSSSDEEYGELDFRTELQEWVVNFKVPAMYVDSLLPILRKKDPSLPKCCKTLVYTPKSNNIVPMDNGNFLNIGIRNELTKLITSGKVKNECISVDIFADGVGVAKSSTSALWPICIRAVESDEILLTHLFHGMAKPKDVNNFLQPFVVEFNEIKDGFEFNGTTYTLCIRSIIADTPARQYLLDTILHSGYNSCTKCTVHGVRVLNRTTFPGVDFEPRTDFSFRNRVHADHHHSSELTMIESLPIDCVKKVPIDVMHCVYLGVVKLLLTLWIIIRLKPYSISVNGIKNITKLLVQLAPQIPSDFTKTLRSLTYLSRFKATEYRLLILYILPVVLKNELPGNYYRHFLKLHCAMRILCNRNECIKNNLLASKLLRDFVSQMPDLYGAHNMAYNVHSILHLADDVMYFKVPLEDFSAFPFENFMQYIKKAPKTGYRVLEQVYNRTAERNYIQNCAGVFKRKKKIDKQLMNSNSYKKVFINNTVLSTSSPDNYVTESGGVFKIEEITKNDDGKVVLKCREILKLKCFYEKPIPSTELDIFEGDTNQKLSEIVLKTVTNNTKKCAVLTIPSSIVYIGLLH